MKIKLEKNKSEWNYLFKMEKDNLIKVLNSEKIRVEHIGSTSIPGVRAKPIIDILIGVEDEKQLNTNINAIIALGYIYVKKYEEVMPFRRYFFKLEDKSISIPQIIDFKDDADKYDSGNYPHRFHIHMVKIYSDFWRDQLLFRDYIRIRKEARLEYNELKENLVREEWVSINDYAKAKSSFIQKTLKEAQNHDFVGKKS